MHDGTGTEDGIHTVERIAPDTYRIDEAGVVNCYLLVGSERSLLVDTCLGMGDLGAVVRRITPTPLDVVLTHMHGDHAGGIGWFERYHVHEADCTPVYKLLGSSFVAKAMIPKGVEVPRKPFRPERVPIEDGFSFDLGDRTVRAVSVPGHTRGSIALVDDGRRLMFTGDDINPSLWLHLPGSVTLEEWLPGGRRLIGLSADHACWYGHGSGRQTTEQMQATYDLVMRLTKLEDTLVPHRRCLPDKATFPQVRYDTARIR